MSITGNLMKEVSSHVRLDLAVRSRREAQGCSQESYADNIGMHRTYHSAVERGVQNITLDTVENVCKGHGVRMWEMMKNAGD